ncbi:MAG: hypothetical protein QXN24_07365 [Candidatus Bathyarchaeia archaeon]
MTRVRRVICSSATGNTDFSQSPPQHPTCWTEIQEDKEGAEIVHERAIGEI